MTNDRQCQVWTMNQNMKNKTRWEPTFHFFKHGHWINDPNGLVFHEGKYHLFYQMNPDDIVWGNMHWGHASSTDLVHWEHHPIALHAEPDGLGYIFSGGAICDNLNLSGLGGDNNQPIFILSFTHHDKDDVQRQSLAYTHDFINFQKYSLNPVLDNPGEKDFRDPKIIWVDELDSWVISIVVGKKVQFYRSNTLVDWVQLSDFGEGLGCQDGVWECPDLFPLYDDKGNKHWVLLISINPGAPNGGSGMQYFVGQFENGKFICDNPQTKWLDYGTDFYAGISWENIDLGSKKRRIIAWMSNWHYANQTPQSTYRSAMTLPRDITLVNKNDELYLAMEIACDLQAQITEQKSYNINQDQGSVTDLPSLFRLKIESPNVPNNFQLVFKNSSNEKLVIDFNFDKLIIICDRTHFNWDEKDFNRVIKAPIIGLDKSFDLEMVFDTCSMELLANSGLTNMTNLLFPETPWTSLEVIPNESIDLGILIEEIESI